MKKTHDYVHCYRGYWSDGGKCRIRIYQEEGQVPVVICSQLPDNDNTSVTNMVELAAERFDIPATGTLPHALALILGSTEAATKAFDEAIDPEVPRAILIDIFDDEKFGALLAAEAIPETIEAIRMDTPGSRRGDFADLMREVRWELDSCGFEHVKIYASGSIGVEDILHLNPYCDAYGVGNAIAAAPMVDYSLDIVEVDGQRRAKRGKMTGPSDSWSFEMVRGR